jgi:hypothetical protein
MKLIEFELFFPCGGSATQILHENNASLVTKMSSHWGPHPWPTCVACEWGEHNLTPMKDGQKTDCFNCPLKKGRTVQSGIPMKKSIYCNHVRWVNKTYEKPTPKKDLRCEIDEFLSQHESVNSDLRKLTEELIKINPEMSGLLETMENLELSVSELKEKVTKP